MASTQAREGARLLQMKLYKDAVATLRKGLEQDPRDAACWLGLSRALLATQDNAGAESALKQLLSLEPEHAEARSNLAALRAQTGDAEAVAQLRALGQAPNAGYFELYNLASFLLETGKLDEAKPALERALALDPNSPYVLFDLGRIALHNKDFNAAVSCFSRSAAQAQSEMMPLVMLSRAHAARGELGAAMQAANRAMELAPTQPLAYEELFKLHMVAGSPQMALRMATQLAGLDRDNANYTYMHGVALLACGMAKEAQSVLEVALKQAPESVEVRRALAQLRDALEDKAGAQQLLEEAVKLAPTEVGPANDLSVLYFTQKDGHARARPLLETVLRTHPDDGTTNLNYAIAVMQQHPALALTHARKAVAHGEQDVREQAERLVKKLSGGAHS